MAKRKTPKTVDLKPRAEKITQEQLENVHKVVNNINRAKQELGGIEVQKHALLHVIDDMNDAIANMRDEFQKDYGTDDINIQDGSINYKEDVKTDKED